MSFLNAYSLKKNLFEITGQKVILRPPQYSDWKAWADERKKNKLYFKLFNKKDKFNFNFQSFDIYLSSINSCFSFLSLSFSALCCSSAANLAALRPDTFGST